MAFYGTWPGGWEVLAAPLFMLLAILTALGLGFLLSAINVRYRDVRYMIPVFLQVLPLLSGVMFAVDSIPEKWQWILSLNPMTAVISGLALGGARRDSARTGQLAVSVSVAASLFVVGLAVFRVVGATLRGHDLMATAIDAQGLGKRYRIGELQAAYGTLRESLSHAAKRLTGQESRRSPEEIWALREVSFEVQQGEVLGVIGRNGAGKSTLLKVLTRITSPTAGRAEIRGRVGSLLEVGTGLPPRADGAREHLPERCDPGHEAPRDPAEATRDRRLLRGLPVPRHAGEALLERDVRSARLLRRGPPRARDPARRRGSCRWRR